MLNYKTLDVEVNGVNYIFVTRGRSKSFTLEEAAEYLKSLDKVCEDIPVEIVKPTKTWQIPNNRQRKIMFLRDIQSGLEFCAQKYGVCEEDIVKEAQRIAPHLSAGFIQNG